MSVATPNTSTGNSPGEGLQIAPPEITAEAIQRGWVELEIECLDGVRHAVRVHALPADKLLPLAALEPREAMLKGLSMALRTEKDFVASVRPEYQVLISATLSGFLLYDAGDNYLNQAIKKVIGHGN